MSVTYGKKRQGKFNVIYAVFTAFLIFAIFLSMVNFFYTGAENEAYEMLHLQTKQIKDDMTLQIKSDRENLVTMAHFASKLYADGEDYDIMFASFEPIGLLSNIGILRPDNVFVTKMGEVDLNGKISFADEAARGEYISGRVPDLTRDGEEIIRTAVPIVSDGETVGILYGVIHIDAVGERYGGMAKELDAQLFVYDSEKGNYVINTVDGTYGNVVDLKNRTYNDGYSYEALVGSEKGYSSFKSVINGEDLYVHYSTMDDIGWRIMLARYESQVFAEVHSVAAYMIAVFAVMLLVIGMYVAFVLGSEKRTSLVAHNASEIRRLLLDIDKHDENVLKALQSIRAVTRARLAFFTDTEGEEFGLANHFTSEERKYFAGELFRYAEEFRRAGNAAAVLLDIKSDSQLLQTNPALCEFLKKHRITDLTVAAVAHNGNNNVSVLGAVNPKNKATARTVLEKIAVCFSIAVFNKNQLDTIYRMATTDSLTGALNHNAYDEYVKELDIRKPSDVSCTYVDVNELHLRNNRFGHAVGNEMLIYIANALKNIFDGHLVFRMGGDEFLVFAEGADLSSIEKGVEALHADLAEHDYHVAVGISSRDRYEDAEELLREAECRMYEAKAKYYRSRRQSGIMEKEDGKYLLTPTGIPEIDTMISVLRERYNGIYRVTLENDHAHRILMPAYLGYNEDEDGFSKLVSDYVSETVHPEYHRTVLSFMNYDAIRSLLANGRIPTVTYKKNNGEDVVLSVYRVNDGDDGATQTLWVFARK